jgi:two-component sensor histidine kinase
MSRAKRILVVDDEERNLLLMRAMLQSLGYECECASDGPEALAKLSTDVDLVLLDVMMPGTDGFEVLARIRENPEFMDLPVIMVTILSSKEHRLQAVETGANDFISKPVNIAELRARLKSLLKIKEAQDQIKASLKEKETLLNELHHRVKNNLATVAGMLRIQARRIDSPEMTEILEDLAWKVASMGLIHERLYQAPDLSSVNAGDYLKDLAVRLFKAHGSVGSGVTLKTGMEAIIINPDTAVPLGQIMTELMSNCLKHAFCDTDTGILEVALAHRNDDTCELIVRDNGVGIPDDVNIDNPDTLGLRLVRSLVSQLRGRIEIGCSDGTCARVIFTGLTESGDDSRIRADTRTV